MADYVAIPTRVFTLQPPPPRTDLSAATAYGQLQRPIFQREPNMGIAGDAPDALLAVLRNRLCDYESRDSVLLMGNPVIIGMAMVAAAEASPDGCVAVLKWDNSIFVYDRYVISSLVTYNKKGEDSKDAREL